MLTDRLDKKCFHVSSSSRDADVLICNKASDLTKEDKLVELHGVDANLLINVIHPWQLGMTLYFEVNVSHARFLKKTYLENLNFFIENLFFCYF